jgi:hypothetical protein
VNTSAGHPEQASAPEAGPTLRFDKEMGITLKEFLRLLPAATGSNPEQWVHERAGLFIPQAEAGHQVRIHYAPESVRRIASLKLPVLSVTLLLSGFSADAAVRFVQRFDRHFQRGGG